MLKIQLLTEMMTLNQFLVHQLNTRLKDHLNALFRINSHINYQKYQI